MTEAILWHVAVKKLGFPFPPVHSLGLQYGPHTLEVWASTISHSASLQVCVTEAKFEMRAMERSGGTLLPTPHGAHSRAEDLPRCGSLEPSGPDSSPTGYFKGQRFFIRQGKLRRPDLAR